MVEEGPKTGKCRGCGAYIEWHLSPNGKCCPYNIDGSSHFTTCPKASQFSKKSNVGSRKTIDSRSNR